MGKKVLSFILISAMAATMFTGCGGNGKTGDNKKLVIWTNMEVETDMIQKYADKWGVKKDLKWK